MPRILCLSLKNDNDIRSIFTVTFTITVTAHNDRHSISYCFHLALPNLM